MIMPHQKALVMESRICNLLSERLVMIMPVVLFLGLDMAYFEAVFSISFIFKLLSVGIDSHLMNVKYPDVKFRTYGKLNAFSLLSNWTGRSLYLLGFYFMGMHQLLWLALLLVVFDFLNHMVVAKFNFEGGSVL